MNIQITTNKIFILAAVLVFLILGIVDVAEIGTIEHPVGWLSLGLGLFALSFLP